MPQQHVLFSGLPQNNVESPPFQLIILLSTPDNGAMVSNKIRSSNFKYILIIFYRSTRIQIFENNTHFIQYVIVYNNNYI